MKWHFLSMSEVQSPELQKWNAVFLFPTQRHGQVVRMGPARKLHCGWSAEESPAIWPSEFWLKREIRLSSINQKKSSIRAEQTQFLIGFKSDNYSAAHKIHFNLLNGAFKIALSWSVASYVGNLSGGKCIGLKPLSFLVQQLKVLDK